MLTDVICDVFHGIRRCNIIFKLERRYKFMYMYTYGTQSYYWREFFIAMAESWKKLKASNGFLSFIVC